MDDRIEILAQPFEAFQALARERVGRGSGFAADIYRTAARQGRFDPDSLPASKETQTQWRREFVLTLPEVVSNTAEPTALGAILGKAVVRARDGMEFECVHIPIGTRRHSLCMSTQVGCAMACRFCETGRMGKLRNLTAAEITGQVIATRAALSWDPKSLVFMGMGEALDNTDELLTAIRVLTDPRGLAFGPSRITVCTVGRPEGIRRLAELQMPRLNLSISLNAADDSTRRSLMPMAAQDASLAELQEVLIAHRPRANFQLGVHYCLLPGINDSQADARAVAKFCQPLGRIMLHVIPYNPGSTPITRPPTDEETDRFIGWLRDEGMPVRRRITKGRSVMAACGQLGDRDLRGRLRDRTQPEDVDHPDGTPQTAAP